MGVGREGEGVGGGGEEGTGVPGQSGEAGEQGVAGDKRKYDGWVATPYGHLAPLHPTLPPSPFRAGLIPSPCLRV